MAGGIPPDGPRELAATVCRDRGEDARGLPLARRPCHRTRRRRGMWPVSAPGPGGRSRVPSSPSARHPMRRRPRAATGAPPRGRHPGVVHPPRPPRPTGPGRAPSAGAAPATRGAHVPRPARHGLGESRHGLRRACLGVRQSIAGIARRRLRGRLDIRQDTSAGLQARQLRRGRGCRRRRDLSARPLRGQVPPRRPWPGDERDPARPPVPHVPRAPCWSVPHPLDPHRAVRGWRAPSPRHAG